MGGGATFKDVTKTVRGTSRRAATCPLRSSPHALRPRPWSDARHRADRPPIDVVTCSCTDTLRSMYVFSGTTGGIRVSDTEVLVTLRPFSLSLSLLLSFHLNIIRLWRTSSRASFMKSCLAKYSCSRKIIHVYSSSLKITLLRHPSKRPMHWLNHSVL